MFKEGPSVSVHGIPKATFPLLYKHSYLELYCKWISFR